MLEKQVSTLTTILKNEDLQNYAGDAFFNLIKVITMSDVEAGLTVTKDIREIIFHTPTILFWDKMKRYLYGTFMDYNEQVKMAKKFTVNNRYEEFVKRQIHLINEMNDDKKIEYFAMLTRSYLLTNLENALFYKLANFINICTPHELEYLQNISYDFKSDNNIMISSLYQYGLFVQEKETGEIAYSLSDFAKALKHNALNFDNGLIGQKRLFSYEQLAPLPITEPATWESLQELLKGDQLILDGGNVV